jgi:hypothetical protein
MFSGPGWLPGYRIRECEYWPGVERNPDVEIGWELTLCPVRSTNHVAQRQSVKSGVANVHEDEVQSVTPCIPHQWDVRRGIGQHSDTPEELPDEAEHFVVTR